MITSLDSLEKARLGAVYTPSGLAEWVASEALLYVIRKNESVFACDPACGEGDLLLALKTVSPRCKLIGFDVDSTALKQSKVRNAEGVNLVNANCIVPSGSDSIKAHWNKILENRTPNLFLTNPPWGIDLHISRKALEELGFTLATLQFDSYEIFCEAILNVAKSGSIIAMILPDSVFYPEKRKFRHFLLKQGNLLLIARLGEGFFEGVYRATTVIIMEKGRASLEHQVRCLRLTAAERRRVLSHNESLSQITRCHSHKVQQERFHKDAENRFDIDLRENEEKTVSKFRMIEPVWSQWLQSTRGVEISKTGRIAECPKCDKANPFPRQSEKADCKFCGHTFHAVNNSRQIIFRQQEKIHGTKPIIVGADVGRYSVSPSRHIIEDVPGIDYKTDAHRTSPRILIRKTGLGIKAAFDTSGHYTNQVVFSYFKNGTPVPDFFLQYVLGVLNSRVLLGYFLKTQGEVEWKSHPYITQKMINSLPIPTFTQGSKTEKQARAIADAVRVFEKAKNKDVTQDLFIDCLVAGLFHLTNADCQWIVKVLNEADGLEPIRTLRVENAKLLRPHIVL